MGGSNIPRGSQGPTKRSLAAHIGNVKATESGGPFIKKAKTDESQLGKPDNASQNEE